MNKKIIQIKGVVAAAALASFALVACDSDTISALNSVADAQSSSSEIEELYSSSEVEVQSSSSEMVESSSSETQVVNSSSSVGLSSSSLTVVSSSSVAQKLSSSSAVETCKHVSDVECEPCPPGEKCVCHPCELGVEGKGRDCATGATIYCEDGEWKTPSQMCPNGRWTTSCNGVETYEPICCTESSFGTCKHITDYDGMTEQGNCVGQNGLTAVDCETDANYICKDNYWQPVACMDVKPDECKPGMGGCGYRLCQPKGIREIADCETSVRYYCDGETWQVVGNVYNKRCADGELDQCEACFNEGVINGQYQCNNGKWKKLGKGDDIKDCELEKEGCAIPVCNALTPECGYSEYELCSKYGIDRYCNDKWLSEPCDGSESSRDLRILESNNSFRLENYICVNNKWVERFKYYECGEDVDCDRPSLRCQESSVIGTACENEGESSEIDGCVFLCSAGRFLYAPPVW